MSNEPVVVATYDSEMEANLAISALEDVGLVSCILNPVNRISYYNYQMPSIRLQLAVKADDAEAARAVLTAISSGQERKPEVETKRRLGKKARSRPVG